MKRLSVIAVAFIGATSAPIGAARAADQIYACVNASSGEIKLVAQNAACKNNETLVVWNVVGPQGMIGPAGPVGPQGPIGPIGPVGPLGPQGPAGVNGAQGPIGPAGANGAQGAIGPAGPQGPIGPVGANGAAGPIGPVGPQGPIGPVGANGVAGAIGPVGPQGPQGPAGANGAQGPTGLPGPAGPPGAAGAAGASSAIELNCTVGSLAVPQALLGLNKGAAFGPLATLFGGNNMLVQPGSYLVHFDAPNILVSASVPTDPFLPEVDLTLNTVSGTVKLPFVGQTIPPPVNSAVSTISGDHLVQITAANTFMSFVTNSATMTLRNGCTVVITQLQ